MLNERDYMRRGPQDDNGNRTRSSGVRCLFILIAVNVLVFLLFRGEMNLCVNPQSVRNGQILQIITAVFMHEDFFHLLFNMYALYFFGMITAPILGAKRFLALFLFSGIAGNILWLAANWSVPGPTILLGASGAVMGVIMTTAMLAPGIEILILFVPFPLKLRTAALIFAGLDIFMFVTSAQTGVAYLAHIGGFLAGYIFSALFLRREIRWDPLRSLFGKTSSPKMPDGWHMSSENIHTGQEQNRTGQGPVTQKELDYLLDKISRDGINALSDAELSRLRQAREQIRGGKS